jgi:predicted DNA-binding protein with PD1-like motif
MACVMRKLLFIILFTGVLITPANAQNEKNMYSYKQIENRYIVSIDNHTEIVKALNAFCKEKGIQSGSISGIGAIGELTLRFFNPKTKAYDDKTFREQMEISNLTGNISSMDGLVYLHLHITVGRSDYSALAGHLLFATLNGAGEFMVEDYGKQVSRVYNSDLGLNIYDFEK